MLSYARCHPGERGLIGRATTTMVLPLWSIGSLLVTYVQATASNLFCLAGGNFALLIRERPPIPTNKCKVSETPENASSSSSTVARLVKDLQKLLM